MKAEAGIAIAARNLAILHGRSLAQHRFGIAQVAARDVNHRHLKVRERKVGIQRERVVGRAQPFVAPRRVTQPEEMTPVRRVERNGPAGGRHRLRRLPRADKHAAPAWRALRPACHRGRRPVARARSRASSDLVRRHVFRARGFVRGELRAGEAG